MVVTVLYLVVFGLPFLAGEHMFAVVAFTQLIQFATPIAAVQVDAVFGSPIQKYYSDPKKREISGLFLWSKVFY